jgi:PmbA protein
LEVSKLIEEIGNIEFDSKIELLNDYSSKAINLGVKQGASQIEVVLQNGYTRTVEIKNNSISGLQQQTTSGVNVRAYIGKQLGIASGTSLSQNSIEEVVQSAVALAKLSPEDENFTSLAEPIDRKIVQVNDTYDPNISNIDPEWTVQFCTDIISGATEKHEKSVTEGQIRANTSEKVIANSLGINTPVESTSLSAYTYVSIPLELTNVGVGSERYVSRKLDKSFSGHELGETATEKAMAMLGSQVAPSKKLPVLLSERAVRQSLSAIIGFGVNGFTVMTKTSYFADKIAEQIGVDGLSVWDDPHVTNGMGARMVDAEGIPTTKIDIVENGVLQNYVTDTYTANKLGLPNTGSATKNPYAKVPRPSISQLQVKEGEDSSTAMLEDMKEGILLESGVGPASGSPNISSQINRGFYLLNGEIQYPLKNSMLGSTVYEFLKGITAISKDLLIEFGSQSPWISVDEASIGGASDKKKSPAPVSMGPM